MKNTIIKFAGLYLNGLAFIAKKHVGKIGFRMFCTPFGPKLKPHENAFLDSAEQFEFYSDKTKLQAYKWGVGPKKILLLHGWESNSFRWKPYVQRFDLKEYTLLAFDAPAHGRSNGSVLNVLVYGQAIRDFIKQFGNVDVAIGHSIGSFASLYAFYTAQELAPKKMVSLACPGEAYDFFMFFKSLLKLKNKTTQIILDYFQEKYGYDIRYFSAERFAQKINAEGLIIHDKKDLQVPVQYAYDLSKKWTNSKLLITKGWGHRLKSTEVLNEVFDFVESNK